MGSPLKFFPHNSVLFVTFSLEQGLLLLSNPTCQTIIKSCLARAQFLYPVKICHFIVNGNHLHLILVVQNPADVPAFIGHFKAETAHRFNQVLGFRKRTVWCDGYDSPVVLTPIRALMAVSYLYANVAKDCQEDAIDLYPGLSSWKMFQKKEHKKQWKFLRRPAFKFIPKDAHNLAGYTREAQRLDSETKSTHTFTIEPNAWLDAFGVTSEADQAAWNQRLVARVRAIEERSRNKRKAERKNVIGAQKLLRQPLTLDYRSKRSGKRMWCLSEKRSARVAFINFLKRKKAAAREVYQRWHTGDFSIPYPLGLFPPSFPKLAELWVPV